MIKFTFRACADIALSRIYLGFSSHYDPSVLDQSVMSDCGTPLRDGNKVLFSCDLLRFADSDASSEQCICISESECLYQ